MGARQQARKLAHAQLQQVKNGVPDAVEWFKQVIAENPRAALLHLVAADLAISRGQGVEWRKPDHPAVVMYRKAVR